MKGDEVREREIVSGRKEEMSQWEKRIPLCKWERKIAEREAEREGGRRRDVGLN